MTGYESFMVGIAPPASLQNAEYAEASSDDLSSEWETEEPDPTPVTKANTFIFNF